MNFSNIIFALPTGVTILVVLVVLLLLFGGKKLPELARGLGRARREFKKASEEIEDEVKSAIEDEERADVRRKLIEEEERAKIRARIEAEERAKLDAEKNKN
ncbi:MAG: twin-arginine translocase TatA/TatE family subunit [Candidatus Spyradosoma sp.]